MVVVDTVAEIAAPRPNRKDVASLVVRHADRKDVASLVVRHADRCVIEAAGTGILGNGRLCPASDLRSMRFKLGEVEISLLERNRPSAGNGRAGSELGMH